MTFWGRTLTSGGVLEKHSTYILGQYTECTDFSGYKYGPLGLFSGAHCFFRGRKVFWDILFLGRTN